MVNKIEASFTMNQQSVILPLMYRTPIKRVSRLMVAGGVDFFSNSPRHAACIFEYRLDL